MLSFFLTLAQAKKTDFVGALFPCKAAVDSKADIIVLQGFTSWQNRSIISDKVVLLPVPVQAALWWI